MFGPCNSVRRALRYWLFPQARLIDQGTAKLDQQLKETEDKLQDTQKIVMNADPSDALRNLMIAMTAERRNHQSGHP